MNVPRSALFYVGHTRLILQTQTDGKNGGGLGARLNTASLKSKDVSTARFSCHHGESKTNIDTLSLTAEACRWNTASLAQVSATPTRQSPQPFIRIAQVVLNTLPRPHLPCPALICSTTKNSKTIKFGGLTFVQCFDPTRWNKDKNFQHTPQGSPPQPGSLSYR